MRQEAHRKERVMRIVLLNTSILTNYGTFRYKKSSADECKSLLACEAHNGTEIISAIGHESTAEMMTRILDYHIEANRIQYRQKAGDIAIVFKMRGRPPEGKILSMDEIEEIGFDFGILTTSDDIAERLTVLKEGGREKVTEKEICENIIEMLINQFGYDVFHDALNGDIKYDGSDVQA